ncbi:hypothetical protein LJC49_06285 [Ruminococcaceae bacterium OttesenSCG-928-I18]|nr:hypothetical protein [Ruminococcaceae bacterium OttesenSCG-928-I18]
MHSNIAKYYDMDNILANIDPLIKQTKSVLRIYKDLKWVLLERERELLYCLEDIGMGDIETGATVLTTFEPEKNLQEFEAQVCRLFENRLLFLFIEKAVQSLKKYPEHGEVYFTIINLQFLSQYRLPEKAMLDKLRMERSTYYRRKRDALFLLGLCLFALLPKEECVHNEAEQLSFFRLASA